MAAVQSTRPAVLSLGLLAVFTAVSMTMLTTGFGLTLVSRPVRSAFNGVAPALGLSSLCFGVWYAPLGACFPTRSDPAAYDSAGPNASG